MVRKWWCGGPTTQRRGVDSIEGLHTRFYYGREGYYPLRASTKENGVFWGVFLPVFGLWGGPPWSEMGGMVVLDTEEGG